MLGGSSRVLLAALAVALAGCSGDSGGDAVTSAAPVSRAAGGDCVAAWNALGNAANRRSAAAAHAGWSVALGQWSVDHAAPSPSGSDLTGEGCSYFFSSGTHWRSYSGGWEADGDLRWNTPQEGRGPRTADQRIQPPNAVLEPDGTLAPLAPDGGSAVDPREWRDVIDDWYDNGEIDATHRCEAVRAAIERVPRHGPTITTAYQDLLDHAMQVCGD